MPGEVPLRKVEQQWRQEHRDIQGVLRPRRGQEAPSRREVAAAQLRQIQLNKQVTAELTARQPEEFVVFTQEFLAEWHKTRQQTGSERKAQAMAIELQESPYLRRGLALLRAEQQETPDGPPQTDTVLADAIVVAEGGKKLGRLDGCQNVIFDGQRLEGNRKALELIADAMMYPDRENDTTILGQIIRLVGRNRAGNVMSSTQAIQSLKYSVGKMEERVAEPRVAPKSKRDPDRRQWAPATQEEAELWNTMKRATEAVLIRTLQTRGIPAEQIRQQLHVLNGRDIERTFVSEMEAWRKRRTDANDPVPANDDASVPAHKYDLIGTQPHTEEVETIVPALTLQDVKAIAGMVLSHNGYEIYFDDANIPPVLFKIDYDVQDLRAQLNRYQDVIPNGQPVEVARQQALAKLAVILDGSDNRIYAQQVEIPQHDGTTPHPLIDEIQYVLLALKEAAEPLGGAAGICSFLGNASRQSGISYIAPRLGVPVDQVQLNRWKAPAEIADAARKYYQTQAN